MPSTTTRRSVTRTTSGSRSPEVPGCSTRFAFAATVTPAIPICVAITNHWLQPVGTDPQFQILRMSKLSRSNHATQAQDQSESYYTSYVFHFAVLRVHDAGFTATRTV